MPFAPIEQDFETLDIGSYPSDWEKDGSTDQQVTDSSSYSGAQSLEVSGSHGGCWQAIANAPLGGHPDTDEIRIAGAIKPAVEGSIGCHSDFYGGVFLRTAVGSWSTGSNRRLFELTSDGVSGSGLDLGSYTQGEWLSYEVLYQYDADADEVSLAFEVDGEDRGTTTVDAADFETDLSHLSFKSGDFTSYWDGITVETASESTTPQTPEPTRTPEPTPEPTAPSTTVPTETETVESYDFEDASVQTEVQSIDTDSGCHRRVTTVLISLSHRRINRETLLAGRGI